MAVEAGVKAVLEGVAEAASEVVVEASAAEAVALAAEAEDSSVYFTSQMSFVSSNSAKLWYFLAALISSI